MGREVNYEVKDRGATEATVQITVSADGVRSALENVYRRYGREIRVPGFRKGHVPRNYLDSRFGRDVFLAEAQDDLQRESVPEALIALGLNPVSRPEANVVSFSEDDAFVFDVTFGVLPEIELPELSKVSAEVPVLGEVTDEDVEGTLGEIQTQFGTLGEKEGDTVGEGDIVRVKEKDQEWDTRADVENPITKHLIGQAIGSTVDVDATLPDDRELKTTFEILGLREVVLPEIDDELAKDAGFDDLEALKTDITARIGKGRANRHSQLVNTRLLDAIVEMVEIPLPEGFIGELLEEEQERMKSSFSDPKASMSFDEYLARREITEEELHAEIRESIELRVRRELTLSRLAETLEIAVDDEELGELAKQDAEDAGEDALRFVARLKAEERWESYRTSKVNERVFAKVREDATVKEVNEEEEA